MVKKFFLFSFIVFGVFRWSRSESPTGGPSPINISTPLEGHVGDNIEVLCWVTPPLQGTGVNLIYRNRTTYSGPGVIRNADSARFILQSVPESLNGTELACAFQELNSCYTPVLLFSPPQLSDGTSSRIYNITIREGASQTINIGVRGYPYPSTVVSVEGPGQVVPGSVTVTPEAITISSASRVDTGQYRANFTNSEGGASVILNLVVQFAPTFSATISDDFICDATSSNIICSARLGSDGSLMCDYDALPEATLTIDTPSGSRAVTDAQTGTITIAGARTEEGGVYNCTASNSVSTVNRTITLQVGTIPSDLTSVSTAVVEDGVTVSWEYPTSGNALPLNFNVQVRVVRTRELLYNTTASGESRSLLVPSSVFTTERQFVVSVNPENIFGEGMGLDKTFVFPLPTSTSPMTTTTTGSSKSTSVSGLLLLVTSLSTLMCTYLIVH